MSTTDSTAHTDLPTTADGDNRAALDNRRHRGIQTFMKRKTHMGKKAQAGLQPEFARFFVQADDARQALDITGITDLRALFAKPDLPLTLEIGFGMGATLVQMAQAEPTRNFVGIEVHEAGLGNCAYLAGQAGLTNLKLIAGDAITLLKQLPAAHIDTLQLYFPDPWPKKRHHKRRFVQPERMAIVSRALKPNGYFHAATDWAQYAEDMLIVLDHMPEFCNVAGQGQFLPRPDFRPLTKFEQRGINEGRAIFDVLYQKLAD